MSNRAADSTDAAYAEALQWLFSQTRAGAPRSVERMERLVSLLSLSAPPQVAHVVGTNGKGTVSAMLAAGMQACGADSGLFISPHVEDFRERISVNSVQISKSEVVESVARLRAAAATGAAFFELSLAMALWHFERERIDFLALEAGVGARSDATMAVGNTIITVISSIALDHQDSLGATVTAIAEDKAAAVRPGLPVVTAVEGEALEVVRRVAGEADSPLIRPETHPQLFTVPAAAGASATRLENQRLAAAALRVLGVPERAVVAGVNRPALPARGEWFRISGRKVLLDGAHDPAAARALVSGLEPGYGLLYAGLGKKQREATLAELSRSAAFTVITELPGEEPVEMDGALRIGDNRAALRAALDRTPGGGTLVVAGSLYLAGNLRSLISELSRA